MSNKAAQKSHSKKESTKKTAFPSSGSPKTEKKIAETFVAPLEPTSDTEEHEEEEEGASESSGQGSNAAALAAAGSSTEMSASFKNFRHHPDMENFYRFIYENDLRHEALAIIDEIMTEKQKRKLIKGAKSQAH
jgi:hypothetical protein